MDSYGPCLDCGSLVSCYCFNPGRQVEDQYSEMLHAVQTGLGRHAILDITDSIWTGLLFQAEHEALHGNAPKVEFNKAEDYALNPDFQRT